MLKKSCTRNQPAALPELLGPGIKCSSCGRPGESEGCSHTQDWHDSYGDCGLRCARGLGWSNLGKKHWGCCFSTDENGYCMQASHTYAPSAADGEAELEDDKAQTPTVNPSCLGAAGLFEISDCPRHRVNLDEPPEIRWNAVIAAHLHQLPAVLEVVEDVLGDGFGANAASTVFAGLTKVGMIHFGAELQGIATAAGIGVGKIALMQIAYEVFAACTSIVVDVDSTELGLLPGEQFPFHIRTMDWDLEALEALTCEVDFIRSGHVVFSATTWPGYVGVMTGVKPGGFSISVNYRRSARGQKNMLKEIVWNLMKGLANSWPVSFLVRGVLEQEVSYSGAVAALQASSLMAPTYITVAGASAGEGIVITRARELSDGLLPNWTLSDQGPIVQTNRDWFADDPAATQAAGDARGARVNICQSIERSNFARAAIRMLGAAVKPHDLWLLMSCPPCRATDTIYTTAMCPRSGEILTRAKVLRKHEQHGKKRWGKLAQEALQSG